MFRWLVACLSLLGILLLPGAAECQSSSSQPPGPSSAADASTASAPSGSKKVWTNENLGDAAGPVSIVGDKRNQKYPLTNGKPTDPGNAAKLRGDLRKLQTELDDIDKKMATYKEFLKGETLSAAGQDVNKGYNRVPVEQQLVSLEVKRKELEARMDTVYEEARKKGIEPGLLR